MKGTMIAPSGDPKAMPPAIAPNNQPSWPAALLIGIQAADQSQGQRNDSAGTDSGDDSPERKLFDGLRRRG
jgi:hypothetical protein